MKNATDAIAQLDNLIKRSFTILVVGHSSPDPDALGSVIATRDLIEKNYDKDDVLAFTESIPQSMSFIPGLKNVQNSSILETLRTKSVDLILCLDFNQWHMISKLQSEAIKEEVEKQGISVAIIDHHEELGMNIENKCYINIDPTSTAANIFSIFHEILKFSFTDYMAQHLLFGIIHDTNRFRNAYGIKQSEILRKTAALQEISSLSIEDISTMLDRYEVEMLNIVAVLLQHITSVNEELAYTYITEDDFDEHQLTRNKLADATLFVANNIITNIGKAKRGFVVYPYFGDENAYTIRFRSNNNSFPVNEWASMLGGGGHIQSAATRVHANSVEEAISIVLSIAK